MENSKINLIKNSLIISLFTVTLLIRCSDKTDELSNLIAYQKTADKNWINTELKDGNLIVYSQFKSLPIEEVFEHTFPLNKIESVLLSNRDSIFAINIYTENDNIRYRHFKNFNDYINRQYASEESDTKEYSKVNNIIVFKTIDSARTFQNTFKNIALKYGSKNVKIYEKENIKL